eukprot:CAMPEP_0118888820 /NCGR_PEP_ID=MMETSP1166-20130328/35_1 /TAXON_ID=1104430 /ORGANISM="Chrysoreinhardia sp, Strain CCMP3193" /LENGTH=307 /DNA_ID=CAMNT_0006827393 /DNA_START=126 /DNA_END=1047 /DNA_ORIENTATION=-
MTEARAKFHGAELILALKHCHDFQVVHRDVKPSNVLMNRYGRIALADFGLCAFKVPLGATPLVTFVGTVAYMSPEILKGDAYGHAVDWWSFGVFLFEITHNGRTPFDGPTPRDLFQNIIKMEQPPFFLDSELSNVLSSSKGVQDQEKLRFTTALLLRKDPATRCGFGPKGALDVMASPFFYDVDWEHLHTLPSPYRRPHIDDDFRRVNLIDDQQTKHDLLARDFNLDTAKEAALANKTNVSVKKNTAASSEQQQHNYPPLLESCLSACLSTCGSRRPRPLPSKNSKKKRRRRTRLSSFESNNAATVV